MGRSKIHLPFGESTILGTTVGKALAAGLRVIVVGRVEDEKLGDLASERVLVLRNSDPDRGMISTLRVGLAAVESERFFFIPADMPLVGPGVYAALAASGGRGPAIPTLEGRRGHPVLLPSSLIPAIIALPEGLPLKTLIEAATPVLVPTADGGIIVDIDDPEEYEAAIAATALPGQAAISGIPPAGE
jgi:molybdenum cofactor cytidylyltransferase